ncbi:MAG: hypothetical protein VB778_00905 [Nitrospinaceae bacterium]
MDSVTAIIRVRMGPTQFPGKNLYPIVTTPVLEHIIIRLKQAPKINHILMPSLIAFICYYLG